MEIHGEGPSIGTFVELFIIEQSLAAILKAVARSPRNQLPPMSGIHGEEFKPRGYMENGDGEPHDTPEEGAA